MTEPRLSASPTGPHQSNWSLGVKDETRSYLELGADWDSYGAGPVRKSIVDAALVVAEVMARMNFSRPNICPQSSGGVLLEWQRPERALTVDLDGIEGFSFAYQSCGVEREGGIDDFVRLLRAGLQPL